MANENEYIGTTTIIEGSAITVDKIRANATDAVVTGWAMPNHQLMSQAGTERIEDGATITDNIVAMPAKLSMVGYVSDLTMQKGSRAPAEAWAAIRKLHREEAIVSIATEWGIYKNMFIMAVDTKQDNRGMKFDIDFQEIVRVGIGEYEPIGKQSATADGRGAEVPNGEQVVQPKEVKIDVIPTADGQIVGGHGTEEGAKIVNGVVIRTGPDGVKRIYTTEEADKLGLKY